MVNYIILQPFELFYDTYLFCLPNQFMWPFERNCSLQLKTIFKGCTGLLRTYVFSKYYELPFSFLGGQHSTATDRH
jgi:hypothetical protein